MNERTMYVAKLLKAIKWPLGGGNGREVAGAIENAAKPVVQFQYGPANGVYQRVGDACWIEEMPAWDDEHEWQGKQVRNEYQRTWLVYFASGAVVAMNDKGAKEYLKGERTADGKHVLDTGRGAELVKRYNYKLSQ